MPEELIRVPEDLMKNGLYIEVNETVIGIRNTDQDGCLILEALARTWPTLAQWLFTAGLESRTPGHGRGYIRLTKDGQIVVDSPTSNAPRMIGEPGNSNHLDRMIIRKCYAGK